MPTKLEILEYLRSIKPQCQKDGVSKLGLFGSYSNGTATLNSDIDIAIKMEDTYLQKRDVWEYFNEISKIKELIYQRFHIQSDVFDLDSASALKDKISKEAIYV